MKATILKLLKTPLAYLFTGVYFVAVLVQSNYKAIRGAEPIAVFIIFFCILPAAIFLISKSAVKQQIVIVNKRQETLLVVFYFFGWLMLFMLLGNYLLSNNYLSNGFGFWGLLVVVPFIYLSKRGYRLSDFGIAKSKFSQNIRISFLACLLVGALLLLLTPGGKFIMQGTAPVNALVISFCISFGYAFLFAGFFEEFFFRGIVQTRLSQYFDSDIKGILLASMLFGIYHLPFQFYNEGMANGNLLYALSNTLTEQMIAAPIFGILWSRTHNLIAPVMLHSLIDAISLMPQIVEKYNF